MVSYKAEGYFKTDVVSIFALDLVVKASEEINRQKKDKEITSQSAYTSNVFLPLYIVTQQKLITIRLHYYFI
jgi:hypothetical protein